jgi:adenylate cyclase
MGLEATLQEISDDVRDVINTQFEFTTTDAINVPHYSDTNLTFENGKTKKGKRISTCVLYIDVRNSVALNKAHSNEIMGKVYTAFVKSMIYAADYYGGSIRNIIGDRVMVVFPPKDCFTKAVDCAILMNTISSKIINKHFTLNEFKCGIGIDYGDMLVLKTGVAKQGKELATYKNLVWIGKPANIASRLTDVANKTIQETIFKVTYNPYNFSNIYGINNLIANPALYLPSLPSSNPYTNNSQNPSRTTYQDKTLIDTLTEKEFAQKMGWHDSLGVTYSGGKFLKFYKEEITKQESPILITEEIYKEYSKVRFNAKDIQNGYWTERNLKVNDYVGKIYGADLFFSVDNIKI